MSTFAPFGTVLDVDGNSYKANLQKQLVKIGESTGLAYSCSSMVVYGEYVYVAMSTDFKMYKLNISDLSVVKVTNFSTLVYSMATDGTYLYCGCNAGYVKKINMSTLAVVASLSVYGGSVRAIAVYGNYVYCGGEVSQKIFKLAVSDLSKVAESVSYGATITALSLSADGIYIYHTGLYSTVGKNNTSDLSQVAVSSMSAYSDKVLVIGSFVYCVGVTDGFTYGVYQLDSSTLAVVRSKGISGYTFKLAASANYIYACATELYKLDISDLTIVAKSPYFGSSIGAFDQSDDIVYVNENSTLSKVTKYDELYALLGYERVV